MSFRCRCIWQIALALADKKLLNWNWSIYTAHLMCFMFIGCLNSYLESISRLHIPQFFGFYCIYEKFKMHNKVFYMHEMATLHTQYTYN